MAEFIPIVKPVKQIRWDNPNIERGGVIPIYIYGGHKWIGFGISNHSAIISPLGGSFEDKDYDLLSTAVREYNEEVGESLRSDESRNNTNISPNFSSN